jgi:hypothetical protein
MSAPLAPLGPTSAAEGFLPPSLGRLAIPLDGGNDQAGPSPDPVEAYFECITTCSLEDGDCVTQCVEILRENS